MKALRDTDPNNVHLVTCRTLNAELLLVPRAEMNAVLGGIIARYAVRYEIDLYAFCILSNHYHLLCQARHSNLALFFENVNKEITKRVNRLLNRRGSLWGGRYHDIYSDKENDHIAGLIYVLTNPVKHGLVSQPYLWPGLTSFDLHFGAKPKEYRFQRWTEYNAARRRAESRGESVSMEDYEERERLKISTLPCLQSMRVAEREALLRGLLEEKVKEIHKKKRADGKKFLGRKKILAQPVQGSFPQDVTFSRPQFFGGDVKKARERYEAEVRRRGEYNQASERFRSGDLTVKFPPFCHKPPLHHQSKRKDVVG